MAGPHPAVQRCPLGCLKAAQERLRPRRLLLDARQDPAAFSRQLELEASHAIALQWCLDWQPAQLPANKRTRSQAPELPAL